MRPRELPDDQRLFLLQKDSTIKIFWTLVLLHLNGEKRVGPNRLAAVSNKSLPTVREALRQLELEPLALVVRDRRYNGWSLSDKGQLYLPSSENFLQSPISIINLEFNDSDIKELNTNNTGSEKILQSPDDHPEEEIEEEPQYTDQQWLNIARLKRSGIANPSRDRIALSKSPDYIESFCNAIDDGRLDRRLAIYLMNNHEGVEVIPPKPAKSELDSLICKDCHSHPCTCEDDEDYTDGALPGFFEN